MIIGINVQAVIGEIIMRQAKGLSKVSKPKTASQLVETFKETKDQMIFEINGSLICHINDNGYLKANSFTLSDPAHIEILCRKLKQWFPENFK